MNFVFTRIVNFKVNSAMANVLNVILRNAQVSSIKHAAIHPQFISIFKTSVRTLYAPASLGLDTYVQQRTRTSHQLANIADKFKQKMRDYTADDAKNMIFTEDLKNMVHLAENEEIDLVIKMMNRFNDQNEQLRFGNFVFGPVVMRMFHHLNKPDEALQCFKSPQLEGFFDQLISYQVLLDLLYENSKYQEILDTFAIIQERQMEGSKYPRNIVVLTLAACYKINTPESLKFALKLWTDLQQVGHVVMRRAVTFCAGLTLNQKQPEATLEIVSSAKNQNYTTIRNLKVAALADIGHIEDIIPLLKNVLSQEGPQKHTFNKDVVEKVRQVVQDQGNAEVQEEFRRIEEFFKEHGHVSDTSLDEQLCMEIATPQFVSDKQNDRLRFNRFQRTDRSEHQQQQRYPNRRPGLSELQ